MEARRFDISTLITLSYSICIASVAYTLVMLISPERYKNQLQGVMSVITAAAICSAFLSGAKGIELELDGLCGSYLGGSGINGMVVLELEKRLEEEIAKLINENGIPAENVSVKTNIDGDNCISISELTVSVAGSKEDYEARLNELVKSRIGDISTNMVFLESDDTQNSEG